MNQIVMGEITAEANNALMEKGFIGGDGINSKTLAEIALPENSFVETLGSQVAYAEFGPKEAPNVVLTATPYFTYLGPHYKARLAAQQAVLGDEYRVVGVEAFSPDANFTRKQRKQMSDGSFKPLSERVFAVADEVVDANQQQVLVRGQSLAADVAVQVAHDARFDSHRGAFEVKALNADEMARAKRRGLLVVKAFGDSGKGLYQNIVDCNVPALHEAWGIKDPLLDEKRINKMVQRDAGRYILAGVCNNLAIIRGFGTAASTEQVGELLDNSQLPILLRRHADSTVTPADIFPAIRANHNGTNLVTMELPGDHSSDDHIANSAAGVLYFARLVA